MPNSTPNRGYTYPLYQEPTMDFPAQIEELAEDIDLDVGLLESFIEGAYNRPSAHVYALANQAVTASTLTSLTFVGGFSDYAVGITPNLAAAGGLTLTEGGVYLIAAQVTLAVPGAPADFTAALTLASSKTFTPVISRTSLRAETNDETWLSVTGLHYTDGVTPDNIRMDVWQNSTTGRNFAARHMSAVKISNIPGGS